MPAVPIGILVLLIIAAVAAPLLTAFDPVKSDLARSFLPPFWLDGGTGEHLLGTDRFGRDIVSRLLYGARVSLSVAGLVTLITVVLGTAVGLIAGFIGGWIDSVLMRISDMVLALPGLVVGMALAIALGPSFANVILVIGLLLWPRLARLIRGEVLLLRQQEFVRYARAVGVPHWLIVLRHILPNVTPTLLVAATLEIGHIILIEASLSFLGAGLPPPEPSWGGMISDGRVLVVTGWWVALFPGLAIVVTVVTFNQLGDWLRDHLDPRLKGV